MTNVQQFKKRKLVVQYIYKIMNVNKYATLQQTTMTELRASDLVKTHKDYVHLPMQKLCCV